MALSISGFTELIILLVILRFKMGNYGTRSIVKSALKITTASAAMAGVMYAMVRYVFPLQINETGFLKLAPDFTLISILGLIVYVLATRSLRVPEVSTVTRIVKHRIRRIIHRG